LEEKVKHVLKNVITSLKGKREEKERERERVQTRIRRIYNTTASSLPTKEKYNNKRNRSNKILWLYT